MREFVYIPKECTDRTVEKEGEAPATVAKSFEGRIVLRVPSVTERLELVDGCGYAVNASGEAEPISSKILRAKRMIELSEKFYIKVELKKLDGSAEFKSFEDLTYDPDCDGILSDIGNKLMEGIRPSKN